MSVSFSVSKDTGCLKVPAANAQKAQMLLTERVANDSNVHCPVDTGSLRASMHFNGASGDIVWPKEYARYVYYGGHVLTGKNPQATPAWFETAKKEHEGEWEKLVEGALNG